MAKAKSISDELIDCPRCKEALATYTTTLKKKPKLVRSYWCLGCGYQTTDEMVRGQFNEEEYDSQLPQLYADLKHVDEEGRVWYPSTVNIEDKGTVFANGRLKTQWGWTAIKTVPLTEEEKQLPKFKDKAFKSDPSTLKSFGTDYIEALDYIGFFDKLQPTAIN